MPQRWLQIKGDPSVRAFLFEQRRIESLFDTSIDRLHEIVSALFLSKGVFHMKIHYSSSQLTCWFAHDPFCYEKFVREEVLEDGFLDRFPDADHAGRTSLLDAHELQRILAEFKRLRRDDLPTQCRHQPHQRNDQYVVFLRWHALHRPPHLHCQTRQLRDARTFGMIRRGFRDRSKIPHRTLVAI